MEGKDGKRQSGEKAFYDTNAKDTGYPIVKTHCSDVAKDVQNQGEEIGK